jgi:hypothetical protein
MNGSEVYLRDKYSVHARAYTAPISVEQQLQQSKEIVSLVDIGFLEEDYSSE